MLQNVILSRLNEIPELNGHVHINEIPQGEEAPFAALFTISRVPSNIKQSVATTDVYRFQIMLYARTYKELMDLDVKIRLKLDGYKTESNGEKYNFWYDDFRDSEDYNADLKGINIDYFCEVKRKLT